MKIKPTQKKGGVVVELGPREAQLPTPAVAEAGAPALFKLDRILVPVDFSECSKKTLQYAIPFARQFNAELSLLFVVQPYPTMGEMPAVDPLPDVESELEELRKSIPAWVRLKTVVRHGEPHAEIVNAARELGMDLIIISTHGRSGLARVVMGSTAEKVVRHAGCPVLVVRENEHEFVRPDASGVAEMAGSGSHL